MQDNFNTDWMSTGFDFEDLIPLYRTMLVRRKEELVMLPIDEMVRHTVEREEPYPTLAAQMHSAEKAATKIIDRKIKDYFDTHAVTASIISLISSEPERRIFFLATISFLNEVEGSQYHVEFNTYAIVKPNTVFFKKKSHMVDQDIVWEETLVYSG